MNWLRRARIATAVRFVGAGERPLIGSPRALAALAAVAVACLLFTGGGDTYADLLLALGAAYAVAALGYNVVLGYSGQMVFGQAGFMATGAYGYAILAEKGLPIVVAFLCACGICIVLGLLVSAAVVRTRELYLALVTFAFAQAAVVVITLIPASNGYNGISVTAPMGDKVWWALPIALIAILALVRLVRSSVGRAFVMVRDDETAAAALGVPVARTRILAFVIGALYGGAGGAMLAMAIGYVSPANFGINLTIFLATIVVVGGLASIWGTVIASAAFVYINDQLSSAGSDRDLIYALIILGALALLPKGVASVPAAALRRLVARGPGPDPATARGPSVVSERPAPADTAAAPTVPAQGGLGLVGHEVQVRFGAITAVDGVDFVVEPGTTVGLIGPNGAGKSTLLNAISGLVPATGSIRLTGGDDTELIVLPAHARAGLRVGRTFQHSRLFGSMSVIEQFVAGAYAHQRYGMTGALLRTPRMTRQDDQAMAEAHALIQELGLSGREYDAVDQLPGPHRRLVDVGRALMTDPRILLLDEVGAGLSADEKHALCDSLEQLAAQRGLTMVIVEHDLDFIRRLASKTIVLAQGRLIAAGATGDVLAHPEVIDAYMGEES